VIRNGTALIDRRDDRNGRNVHLTNFSGAATFSRFGGYGFRRGEKPAA
jgi:hypothetical protein